MGSWTDNDGLHRKFGVDKTTGTKSGEYVTTGALREVEVKLNLADLTQTETVVSDVTFIPAGARIAEVKVITTTAAATGTAIDVGLIRTDRTTELDYNGFLAAFPTASMSAAGETLVLTQGSSNVGALVGTTLANVGYITASMTDATAFTAGAIVITIKYYIP